MVNLSIQFPYVKGSTLYDGTKHNCDAVDAAKIGRTNIFVLEYIDHTLNKRSRCLIQKGKERVSHIPLYDKTGLNKTFDYWKQNGQATSVNDIFKFDKDIGITSSYPNLDAFMSKIEENKRVKTQPKKPKLTQEQIDRINRKYDAAVQRALEDPIVVKESVLTTLGNAIENLPDVPETGPTEIDRGDLGFYSNNPAAFGPGRQSGFGRPMMYVGGRPFMGGPRGPVPPREGPVPEGPIPDGPIPDGPIPEGPHGPRK